MEKKKRSNKKKQIGIQQNVTRSLTTGPLLLFDRGTLFVDAANFDGNSAQITVLASDLDTKTPLNIPDNVQNVPGFGYAQFRIDIPFRLHVEVRIRITTVFPERVVVNVSGIGGRMMSDNQLREDVV